MPSTRVLADDLTISRTTILSAFEQLKAEGYLEATTGSGTYVARSMPEQAVVASRSVSLRKAGQPVNPHLSHFSARTRRGDAKIIRGVSYRPFQPGFPTLDAFPSNIWTKLLNRSQKRANTALLGYGNAAGYLPLRKAIATYLMAARGVRCQLEQVIVVAGAQQAFSLAIDALLDAGDTVLLEDPGYVGAQVAFEAAPVKLLPVPVDNDGLNLSKLRANGKGTRLVYTTPSHQFPLGVSMSAGRRMQLVNWAAESGAWILEDDYDGEFRYSSRPLPALQSFDQTGSVIYVGTFSKVLFPGLRLGYIVVPAHVVDAFTIAKTVCDYHCPTIPQAVVAEFINEGHFGRHIRRMRMLYRERLKFSWKRRAQK